MSEFSIDKFPTSKAGRRMLRRVSPIYDNDYVMKWLYQVMGMEWDEMREAIEDLRYQAFPSTVTWGIEWQEHSFSIVPDDSLSLEERRRRLRRKEPRHLPLNPALVEKHILECWGIHAEIDETYAPGVLRLTTNDLLPSTFQQMLHDLCTIKPSHLSICFEKKLHGDTEIGFGFAFPLTQEQGVIPRFPQPSGSHPLGLGFLSDDTMRGIRPAIPEVVPAKDVRGFLLGSLFPAHLRAVHEPIELRRRSSGGRMTGIFAAVLWAGRRGVRQRLPAGCRTDAAVPCIVLPDTCLQSIRAAMPGKVHGGLSHAVLLGSLFPRHVGIRKQA